MKLVKVSHTYRPWDVCRFFGFSYLVPRGGPSHSLIFLYAEHTTADSKDDPKLPREHYLILMHFEFQAMPYLYNWKKERLREKKKRWNERERWLGGSVSDVHVHIEGIPTQHVTEMPSVCEYVLVVLV